MSRTFDRIDDDLRSFIGQQRIFFVATAPLDRGGLVNISPKGLDTFRVIDDRTVAYLDYTGSGVETIAHLRENGRIVLMFCSFEGPPRIVRFHGIGAALLTGDPDFADLSARFPPAGIPRSVIRVAVTRISDSCGYGVPLYDFKGDREMLMDWCEKKGTEGIREYQSKKNRTSIDGLPGLGE